MSVALELDGVSFAYLPGQPVLADVDLSVQEGEFVAIAGPNGGGKTTLVRLALGLARPQAGSARLFGEPAHRFSRRATLGYVAQRAQVGTQGPVTVREAVAAGRLAQGGLLGPLRSKGKDVLFLGWFGPIGAAALYYAAFSYRETGIEAAWTVGSLVICASVLVHGITATPLTKLYGRLPQNV